MKTYNMKNILLTLMVFGSFEALAECVDSNYHNCQGAITYSDGTLYVGEFKDGLPNGQGTFTYGNGKQYEGGLKNGCLLYTSPSPRD